MQRLEKNTIVTLPNEAGSSNTYIVDTDEGLTVLLSHPLSGDLLLRRNKDQLNLVQSTLKDSTEKCLDYANTNSDYLDFNTNCDLDSLCAFFFVRRRLSPRQKQSLAQICGILASIKFNNDLVETMNFISKNQLSLDSFNLMWYNNFKGLFTGRQPITSKKQSNAIYNIAGYLLAELETPSTRK